MVVINKKKGRAHRDFSGCSEARFPWQQEQQKELEPWCLTAVLVSTAHPLAPNSVLFPTVCELSHQIFYSISFCLN